MIVVFTPGEKIPKVQSFLLQRGSKNSTPGLWDAPHPSYTSNYQHHDFVVASGIPMNRYLPIVTRMASQPTVT